VAGAVVICSIYEWRLGLLSMLVTPLIALSFYISMLFIGGYEDSSLQKSSKADRISYELILNIKTAFALNYQERMLEMYQRAIE
jgi:ABC-type bacteriocin/lantibiotic exporter with double-glycine peptidase domain